AKAVAVRKRRVAVNCPIFGATNPVVHWRKRQHLNTVDDLGYAFDSLYGFLRIGFENRLSHRPQQRDGASVHLKSEVVENAKERQSHKLMAHFFGDSGFIWSAVHEGVIVILIAFFSD